MSKRRIALDLYRHTGDDEIADILESLREIGLDDARVEEQHVPADLTEEDRTNLIAALALAITKYADPEPLLVTLAKIAPASAVGLREARYPCSDCGAPAGKPCFPEYGCDTTKTRNARDGVVVEVTGWDKDGESISWTGRGETEDAAIENARALGEIVEVGDVRIEAS